MNINTLFVALITFCSVATAVAKNGESLVSSGVRLIVDSRHGDIVLLSATLPADTLFSTCHGEGLWRLRFEDDSTLTNRDIAPNRIFVSTNGNDQLTVSYHHDKADVSLPVRCIDGGYEWNVSVERTDKNVNEVSLPLSLDLQLSGLESVVMPIEQGIKLNPSFYAYGTKGKKWSQTHVGTDALKSIAGIRCKIEKSGKETDLIKVNPDYAMLLGSKLTKGWNNQRVMVGRPAIKAPDIDIIGSDKGSFLSVDHVGQGLLMRFSGKLRKHNAALASATVANLVEAARNGKLDRSFRSSAIRNRVVVLRFDECPENNHWNEVSSYEWADAVKRICPDVKVDYVSAMSQMIAEFGSPDVLAVVNPYGECLPKGDCSEKRLIDSVKGYLHAGGIWVETGGYPFYSCYEAKLGNRLDDYYPFAFCDFFRVEMSYGRSYSFYGVQPMNEVSFVPMYWSTYGDAIGGHIERKWFKYLGRGTHGETPKVRFVFGNTIEQDIKDYRLANGFGKPLEQKMDAATLAAWKKSLLISYSASNLKEQADELDKFPSPSLLYVTNYLRGGFDKQYPDLLPPNPQQGNMDDFLALSTRIREKGMLFMPYTNCTWWCDQPKGPWFKQHGNDALSLTVKGEFHREVYGSCPGWSVSPWHPDHIEASMKMSREMVDAGAAVLFQDQSGARGVKRLKFDFNPAAPTPDSYVQGFVNLSTEISKLKPLATEHGHDHMLDAQTEFCGLSYKTMPYDELPWMVGRWLIPYSDSMTPDQYELYPLAQMVAGGNAFFANHLGDATATYPAGVSWHMVLGYHLFIKAKAGRITPINEAYMQMLSHLQKTIGYQYMGVAPSDFEYLTGSGHHGVIRVRYDKLTVVGNFSDEPYVLPQVVIAPGGFYASSPMGNAGYLLQNGSKRYSLPTYVIAGREYPGVYKQEQTL